VVVAQLLGELGLVGPQLADLGLLAGKARPVGVVAPLQILDRPAPVRAPDLQGNDRDCEQGTEQSQSDGQRSPVTDDEDAVGGVSLQPHR
jgi:hypothetical protein